MKPITLAVASIVTAVLLMTGCKPETQKAPTAAENASAESKETEAVKHISFKSVTEEPQLDGESTEPIEVDVDTLEMLKQLGRTWGVESTDQTTAQERASPSAQ